MSHQIKINLANESSTSETLQPIIISWTNPSTDNQSQMIEESHIKQEDELQIISQVIREVPHPASKKSPEIVSPTRVLRSHGKIDKSPVIVTRKIVKASPKLRNNSKSLGSTQNVEVFTKTIDLSSSSVANGDSSPTAKSNPATLSSKNQTKSSILQDNESNSVTKSSKKLGKNLPNQDELQKSKYETIIVRKRRYSSKSATAVLGQSDKNLKIDNNAKNPENNHLKRDKNGNCLKTTNGSDVTSSETVMIHDKSQSSAQTGHSSTPLDQSSTPLGQSSTPLDHSSASSTPSVPSFNNIHIKIEKELDIMSEEGPKSQDATNLTKNEQNPSISENSDSKIGKIAVKSLKSLQKLDQSSTKPKNSTEPSFSAIKEEAVDEVTIKIANIEPKVDVKQEPKDTASENSSSTSQTASSPLKYFKIESNTSVDYNLGLDVQHNNKFSPLLEFSADNVNISVDSIKTSNFEAQLANNSAQVANNSAQLANNSTQVANNLAQLANNSTLVANNSAQVDDHKITIDPEPSKYEDENEDDDDDEDRLVIKEEEDDIETIDITDSDDEQPKLLTPKKHQNSWNNINSQYINPDSNSIGSQVSISYPSIDGSSSLQPPVIQITYQFPMDSQTSASSTQIQRHFMSSGLESSSSQVHKNLGQQSTFGQLFSKNTQSGVHSKHNLNQNTNLDQSKVNLSQVSKNLCMTPSTSQAGTSTTSSNPKTSKKRSNSSLLTQNPSKIFQSSSKSLESQSKKQKVSQDSNKIPIIPYIPPIIPPRRISSTSSDGSSSTSHPFQCKMCMAIFRRKIDMIHHLKSHSEAKFECQRCGMKFKFEGYFIKHECIACELCGKTFFLKQQLRNHQRIEHDIQMEMYECDLCGKKLRYRHGVLYHMSKTHMMYLEDKYGCDVCGKRFKLKESIRLHIKNHESVIECKLCDKKVKRVNLNVHMKCVHATTRNFKCRICRTSFKTKECLKSHIRTHEKSFECTECNKRFSNKSHLKEHMEWHKNPDAYKCKTCQKSFSQKYCLKAHVKLHESGHLFTKFKCSSCPYSTDKAENLEKHELKHKRQEENEEMRKNWLQCEKCPVKLKNKLKLATHYWKKHSEVMPK